MYQFSLGPVNLGAGVRVFSLIIENFAYPEIYGELVLNPFTINLSVGGLEFLMFGLLSDALTTAGDRRFERLRAFDHSRCERQLQGE